MPFDLPRFGSEAEEGHWWDTHPTEVESLFKRSHAAGAIARMHGDAPVTMQTTIWLNARDEERARAIARRKGLRYESYLEKLVHEELERESKGR